MNKDVLLYRCIPENQLMREISRKEEIKKDQQKCIFKLNATNDNNIFRDSLFELMFYVPVNSNGHVGTLPPFYGTFTQH